MIGFVATLIAAAASSGSYGDSLLKMMHSRHRDVISVRITAAGAASEPIILQRSWGRNSTSAETRVLRDANGNEIGTIELHSRCSPFRGADLIESEFSRRIYSAASLTEPDPLVASATRAATAQAMIEDAIQRDPTIITLAFHVTPPGDTANSIVASSFGRIGKPADTDDLAVIRDNKLVQELTNKGKRLAIELPLLDLHGQVIGALSTSFKMEPGLTTDEVQRRAIALRDSLSRRTPSIKALFRPATASRQVGSLRACRS